MNPYKDFVEKYSELMREGKRHQLGGFQPLDKSQLSDEATKVVHFSPHPDDESIIGALPLRLLREMNMRVINVPVTYGSNLQRRKERYQELVGACEYLGFEILQIQEDGLSSINPKGKIEKPENWTSSVSKVAHLITNQLPWMIILPHRGEFNTTHQGTNELVFDALADQDSDYECYVVEWEYWTPLEVPNLLLEVTRDHLADLITALSFHVGEVKRNPQHVNLPPWMQDNVRRGSEIVGVPGGTAPPFEFATIYMTRKWQNGGIVEYLEEGKFVGSTDDLSDLFP